MSMDTNKDGTVSREEFMKKVDEIFARLDANKDAVLTRDVLLELPMILLTPAKR